MKKTVIALESIFTETIMNAYPLEWDENHISFKLMGKLREIFNEKTIIFNGFSKIVHWQSFKNRGKQEQEHGDIALLVNIQFSSGEILKGVAQIEAKRDAYHSNNFESISMDQLDELIESAPYSHLLLYSHSGEKLPIKFPDEVEWKSHLWISPINTAIHLLKQTTASTNANVFRTTFPFTMFLTSRIFWGLDLDYREDTYRDIENGIHKVLGPTYLGVINVYYDNQRPIEVNLSDMWEQI